MARDLSERVSQDRILAVVGADGALNPSHCVQLDCKQEMMWPVS